MGWRRLFILLLFLILFLERANDFANVQARMSAANESRMPTAVILYPLFFIFYQERSDYYPLSFILSHSLREYPLFSQKNTLGCTLK